MPARCGDQIRCTRGQCCAPISRRLVRTTHGVGRNPLTVFQCASLLKHHLGTEAVESLSWFAVEAEQL